MLFIVTSTTIGLTMSVLKCFVAISALVLVSCEPCYWRSNARYNVYSTKTAYVSVRGDIRDARILPGKDLVYFHL